MNRLVGNDGADPDLVSGEHPEQSEPAATALWYVAPGQAELRKATLPLLAEASGAARVRTLFSAVSRGTERLVAAGMVPQSEHQSMRAPLQEGEFPFPVKYGYCAVGRVEDGPPDLKGRVVFALHPHQDRFVASHRMLNPLPEDLPAARAVLAANMETALNAIWDSGATAADRIVVVGAGVVGLLVAYLAARLPGAEVTVVDVNHQRAALAGRFGARFAFPADAPVDADVVFHASATPAGLATALGAAGMEATVVELSWYGDAAPPAPLGGAFHSRRLRLLSSQVGQVSPRHRPRWSYQRRMQAALSLLQDERLDALITETVAFSDLPAAIPRILSRDAAGLVTLVAY
jgi:NADPH:quinone reductase-like Zn-dependent oxidoreductase